MTVRFFLILLAACAVSWPAWADQNLGKSPQTPAVTGTPQEKRLSDLMCWQGGQKVVDERGIRNFMFGQEMVYGNRADGSHVTFLNIYSNSGTICRLVERENILP